jgi:RNA polymerase primary sigma factor
MHQLAFEGARIRVAQVQGELDALFERFPELRHGTAGIDSRTHAPARRVRNRATPGAMRPGFRPAVAGDLDGRTRQAVRVFVLGGLRDGAVSRARLDTLCENDRYPPCDELRGPLLVALGDLGIVVDEEEEIGGAAAPAPPDSADERTAREALTFASSLLRAEDDPLEIYLTQIRPRRPLPEGDELAMASEFESAMAQAIDGLARWRGGLGALLEVVDRLLRSSATAGPESTAPADPATNGEPAQALDRWSEPEDIETLAPAEPEPRPIDSRLSAVASLRVLASGAPAMPGAARRAAVAAALHDMAPSREFLEGLCDGADAPRGDQGRLDFSDGLDRARLAWQRLTESHLAFVVPLARRFVDRGLPLSDLVQEGNIGLMRAVEKFDHHLGHRLRAYARAWILQAVSRSIANSVRMVRLPVHLVHRLAHIAHAGDMLEGALGRKPERSEIAACLGLSIAQVDRALLAEPSLVTLDQAWPERGGPQLEECIADDGETPEDRAIRRSMVDAVERLVGMLAPREADVIRRRFGLGRLEPQTLEEIARSYGLTRERIRQIELNAMKRLRHPARLRRTVGSLGGLFGRG